MKGIPAGVPFVLGETAARYAEDRTLAVVR